MPCNWRLHGKATVLLLKIIRVLSNRLSFGYRLIEGLISLGASPVYQSSPTSDNALYGCYQGSIASCLHIDMEKHLQARPLENPTAFSASLSSLKFDVP